MPKFCPRECPGRQMCRYQRYLEESRKQDVFIQICNHNYLLADAYHRADVYKRQIYGKMFEVILGGAIFVVNFVFIYNSKNARRIYSCN